jgi:hypothetical protein
MRTTAALPAIVIVCLWSCSSNPDLVAPRQSAGPILSASSWGPETPPFNNEIILHDVTGNGGFGHVKFRQPNDADRIVYLDTWVRDLQPNTNYRLQRATDANINNDCTGTNWLTLGMGAVPQSITTDSRGTGRAALFRNLAAFPVGSTFDIHFRVIDAGGAVVLESGCYQFVVTQ